MALPTTISGVAMANQNYFHGPFIDGNGNVYVILNDETNNDLEAWKATDPTDSFTEQDNAGSPTNIFDNTIWCFQDGDTIHCASTRGTAAYVYHKFYTSDHATLGDTWDNTVVDEEIENPVDDSAAAEVSISIVARGDGTVVAIYNGDEDSNMGNPYARVDYNIRSSGGSWGGPVTLVADEKAAVDWFGSVAVKGASDKTHFFYIDGTNTQGKHRSLTSGDSLGSIENTINETAMDDHPNGPGVFYDDAGTERIRVPWMKSDVASTIDIVQIDGDDGSPAIVSDAAGTAVTAANGSPNLCSALDGTTMHLLFAEQSDGDLYHNQADAPQDAGDWGADTEFKDAATINRICCNVIDRSGKKLAMVYDDGGTIMYDEKDIAGAPTTSLPVFQRPWHFWQRRN